MSDADAVVTLVLTEPERKALDAYRTSLTPPASRDEMLRQIVMDWLANNAKEASGGGEVDEGMRPAELNASNDI